MSDAPADAPAVEVIVPVHDSARPLARAVASVAESGLRWGDQVVVTVVAHNLPVDAAEDMLASVPSDALVTVLACDDGLPSPAGPRTLALERSRARYVSFLDSDDWLEPGALAHWLRLAERHDLAAVIAPERHAPGRAVLNPPVRPLHVGALHPRRDRLPYRTALRGLLERTAILEEGLRFSTGVTNGSDQPPPTCSATTRLAGSHERRSRSTPRWRPRRSCCAARGSAPSRCAIGSSWRRRWCASTCCRASLCARST